MVEASTEPPTTTAPGATIDDVRRQNLRQVLRLAHEKGPLSRADLTRATGLNRSTIGGLVVELQDRGLIGENGVARTNKVGRPSASVIASDETVAVAVNPEIDAFDVAIVGLSGNVLHRVRYKNERIPTVTEFVNIVTAIMAGMGAENRSARVLGVGVAVPGLVRESDGHILLAPHLGWRDAPIGTLIEQACGLQVYAGNDANCGAIAETTYGAGRGDGTVVYLNGGASGIGSGIVIDGRLIAGTGGHAGEFGHTLVNSGGVVCHCGATGCLETEVRRDRLVAALDSHPGTEELLDRLREAWRYPGAAGHDEIERQLAYLGVAIRTIINALNPRRLVLGGFLAQLLEVVGEARIKQAVGVTLPGSLTDVAIVGTSVGEDLLLIGAAELVFRPVLDDPTRVPARA